jgi:hypothetical protein
MIEQLDLIFRFWQLRTTHEGKAHLTPSEQAELWSMMRMLANQERLPSACAPPRTEHGVPVQLAAPGGFLAGELRRLYLDGFVIACATPLRPGRSTIARLADAVSAIEYALPCHVEWSFRGSPSAMGLRISGMPTRTAYAIPTPGMWRSPLGWTERAWHLAE